MALRASALACEADTSQLAKATGTCERQSAKNVKGVELYEHITDVVVEEQVFRVRWHCESRASHKVLPVRTGRSRCAPQRTGSTHVFPCGRKQNPRLLKGHAKPYRPSQQQSTPMKIFLVDAQEPAEPNSYMIDTDGTKPPQHMIRMIGLSTGKCFEHIINDGAESMQGLVNEELEDADDQANEIFEYLHLHSTPEKKIKPGMKMDFDAYISIAEC